MGEMIKIMRSDNVNLFLPSVVSRLLQPCSQMDYLQADKMRQGSNAATMCNKTKAIPRRYLIMFRARKPKEVILVEGAGGTSEEKLAPCSG